MYQIHIMSHLSQEKLIATFGRRVGKKLSLNNKIILSEMLPQFLISSEILQNIDQKKEIILEIGFGMGEHIIHQARAHPNILFIGADPYINGVASLLKQIIKYDLKNVMIWPDDVRLLLNFFPQEIFSKIFILFPDPWPKHRHHKRRLVNKNNIENLIPYLHCQTGYLIIATDHFEYSEMIQAEILQISNLHLSSTKQPDIWVKTKYQIKALAGKYTYYFSYQKI